MDANDPKRFSASFSPAYAAKVELACPLSPKFEKEIPVTKLKHEPKMLDAPPHQDMNRKFEVLGQREGGHNLTAKTSGVPRGAQVVKMRGPEDAQPKPPPALEKPGVKGAEALEEVIVVPSKGASDRDVSDAKVIERIERMMKAEQRARDLEDENRVLTKTIARLQTENDRLKESGNK
jgi:hypothetical protein